MNWFYAEAGQQRGPVPQEEFDRLVAAGIITDTTLVWREGLGAWQPWSAVRPIGAEAVPPLAPPPVDPAAAALAPGRVRCAECGGEFAADDTIPYGERRVCAACQPRFVQRLIEGAKRGPADGRFASREQVLARDYQVDLGRCFDRSLKLNAENRGLLMGALVVAYVLQFAAQLVPLLGYLAPIFLSGPLLGGMFLVYLQRLRGQPAEVSGVFSGFGPRYWQLVLVQFIQSLITGVLVLPLALLAALPLVVGFSRAAGTGAPPALTTTLAGTLAVGVLVVLPVVIFLSVSWLFSLLLVADKGLEFWPAMELSRRTVWKHWWRVFGLFLVAWLLTFAGLLLCLVGALFTAPIATAMICYLYEDLFGDLAPQSR